jgi:hypothetical protein
MGTVTGGDEGCPVGRLFGVPVGTLAVVLTVVLAAAFGLAAVAAECLGRSPPR